MAERFFLNLKMERIWQKRYVDRAEARRDITQYIVGFYNPVRLHSTLGYESLQEFEDKLKQQTTLVPVRKNLTTTWHRAGSGCPTGRGVLSGSSRYGRYSEFPQKCREFGRPIAQSDSRGGIVLAVRPSFE